ncbi:MAG TPA: hydroxylamine reductase [Chlorobaculum sp.]|jgi:hydroxylamine reductase|uniref:Hydroxylamine reductase n=2 Tax=Chlorobaculum tepidum TaxID=1097 RepID=HCP_CHLTE|nr:RecName: Full=Hydroxylamine reductase; AltName: Full=Hybrid-cluster protein; Short=HCP; AltName: Full=Prismane protein [Chlorobaculum tepidum TLS]AAM72923.1 prismane family protein [Chlorobaculum tepidum TLS]HBU22551.1 hydroxylamine reductase [Chlorobaculum sp.]
MHCDQCQESIKGGCNVRGVCGKDELTAKLQDTLIYAAEGIALCAEGFEGKIDRKYGQFISECLFVTVTNTNFDDVAIVEQIRKALAMRDEVRALAGTTPAHDAANWSGSTKEEFLAKAAACSIDSLSADPDLRSLKSLILYGIKGLAAYTDHAAVLGYHDDDIYAFYVKGLSALTKELPADELLGLVMECGATAVKAMALLDKANTETYGNPEITTVKTGVGTRPGILISGHDLRDMEDLLKQTEGTGVDVYTHCEMLPAHYYPAFKKYDHFVGNYGNSWWSQDREFESFNGPILMTTNCIVPVRESYRGRMFTTGMAGYPGLKHIPARPDGGSKDFSEIIELAKTCKPPIEIENGEIVGGFAHTQVLALADKVVDAVKSGAIRRFVVMAGCDGRHNSRQYYTDVAETLPKDTVILTAGCAKYRYNKLELGDIGGIPRVLDAGQCNDSYSLAVIAMKLQEVFGLENINDLPISYDIAWYEQKAVTVLLALLFLGVKGIRLGPTLPEFLTPNIATTLVKLFDLKPIGTVEADVEAMMAGN